MDESTPTTNVASKVADALNEQNIALAEKGPFLDKLKHRLKKRVKQTSAAAAGLKRANDKKLTHKQIGSKYLQEIESCIHRKNVSNTSIRATNYAMQKDKAEILKIKEAGVEASIKAARDRVQIQEALEPENVRAQKQVFRESAESSKELEQRYLAELQNTTSTSVESTCQEKSFSKVFDGHLGNLDKSNLAVDVAIRAAKGNLNYVATTILQYSGGVPK